MAHLQDIPATYPVLRSIMDASPIGIVVFDHEARVICANDLAEQLVGKSVDALFGNRSGGFIACHHSHSDLGGSGNCGHFPSCPFYKAIRAVLEENTDPDVKRGEALVQCESDQPSVWLKFKASGILLDGHKAVIMAVDDITEMKQAEAALHDSARCFRLMFMNAPMPYQSLDEHGNFIEVNQAFLDVLGYDREDLIGRNFGDILHPDWVDHFKINFPKFKAIGILGVEYAMVKKDGATILVFLNGKIQHDVHGRFERTHCIFQDITEHKRAEAALRESEKKYRNIFENAPVGIFQTTSQGRFLSVNLEYARMAGYGNPSEMIEQVSDIASQLYVRPEERDHYKEMLQRHGQIRHYEVELKRRDGSTFWVSMNAKALRDRNGGIVYDGFLTDVTERVHAGQALRNAEARQRAMIANIADVIVIIDKDGIIRFKSANIEKWFGWRSADLLETLAWDNVHPEDLESALKVYAELVLEPNGIRTVESRYRCKDGSYKWIEFTGTNLLHVPVINGILGNYRDITNRKQADDELRKQNDFTKTILDNLPIGLAVNYFEDGAATYINHAFEKIYGWPKEALKDVRTFFEKIYPDPGYRNEILTRVQNDVASGDPERMHWEDIHVTAKDGSKRIITAKNIPLLEQNIMVSTVQDITQQKHAEHELWKERQRLANIIEGTNVGTWQWNIQTGETIFNERWAEIIGYTLKELSPVSIDTWMAYAHPDDLKQSEELLARHFAGELSYYECECRMRHKDGSWVWVLDRGRVSQWSADGQPLLISGTHQDITKSKTAEAFLRESEERFEKAFISSPAPLVIAEIDTGRFIDVNDRWVQMIGYGREEQIGRTSTELGIWINSGDRDLFISKLKALGHFKDEPVQFRKKAGDVVHALWSAELVTLAGKQVILGMLQDESERKTHEQERTKLQQQLIQAQKMESIGRLAGGVAHDYNNMLSIIVGYTEMLLDKVQPQDPLHVDLTEIFKAAQRSTDITRQLLAFARKQTIAPKVVDLNAIVERMLRMLGRLIGEDIDLTWMPGNRVWPVKIDPSQIDQVLANLCVNARDAIAGVGKVTIETGNITLDNAYCKVHIGFLPGEFLMLAVSDNGCGMDKKILENIFEPFFTTKGLTGGTGLGLATVYGIVKQNNGFINVYSEPGMGTTFRIYLPRHIGDKPAMMVATKTKTPRSNGEMVLLVEDEPSIMRMAEIMLKRIGYQVLAAGTPGQALSLADKHAGKIALLITDVVMPEMSGRDLANQIHCLCPNIKTLFMSGYTANVIAHNGVLDEGVNFIQKPFSLYDLGIKIRRVLDEK
jgi:two-component system, cell cycle sensor histidine kinase and response regulator CckA